MYSRIDRSLTCQGRARTSCCLQELHEFEREERILLRNSNCPMTATTLTERSTGFDLRPSRSPRGNVTNKGVVSFSFSDECSCCMNPGYCPSPIASFCKKCEPGTFSSEKGKRTCERCPMGFFVKEAGATKCNKCPPGTFCKYVHSGRKWKKRLSASPPREECPFPTSMNTDKCCLTGAFPSSASPSTVSTSYCVRRQTLIRDA